MHRKCFFPLEKFRGDAADRVGIFLKCAFENAFSLLGGHGFDIGSVLGMSPSTSQGHMELFGRIWLSLWYVLADLVRPFVKLPNESKHGDFRLTKSGRHGSKNKS